MADKKELNKVSETAEKSSDPELDELLDSALEDLTKKPENAENKETTTENSEDPQWTEEFIRQASQQFESNMANLFQNVGAEMRPENLQENFQKMAEAAAMVINNPTIENNPQADNFASTISQTLQNLSLGSENLQNPFSESEIMNMFSENTSTNQFLPFMQGMMQSLLSKEVLLPSLKDILERYPEWLEKNKPSLPANESERYEKQMNLMRDVCQELEREKDTDSDELKRERFEKVLGLMQTMQDLGQPPPELIGSPTAPGMPFDALGNPIIPENMDPNNCQIM